MRHRDGDDSDGDSRSTVRFTSTPQESSGLRERVLDTEDAARGPLSGIFRLTDSPRVMRKLQEYERAGKRKKEEPPPHPVQQPQPPKPQVNWTIKQFHPPSRLWSRTDGALRHFLFPFLFLGETLVIFCSVDFLFRFPNARKEKKKKEKKCTRIVISAREFNLKNATEKFFCVPFTLYSLTIHPFRSVNFAFHSFELYSTFSTIFSFFLFCVTKRRNRTPRFYWKIHESRFLIIIRDFYQRLSVHRVRAFLSSDEIHRIIPFINRIVDSAGLVSFHTDVFVFDSDSAPQNFHTDSLITASDIQEMDREGQFDGQARRKVEISRSRVEMKSLGCRFIRQLTKFSKSSMRSTSRTKEKEKEKRKTSIVPFMDTKRK